MAKIYLKFNTAIIKEIELTKDEITFGRKSTNDIEIDNPAISGSHGKIIRQGDKYVVEDLNSTNGTFVNGQRIKTHTLRNKDQIGVARHVLEFVAESTTVSPPAAEAVQVKALAPTPITIKMDEPRKEIPSIQAPAPVGAAKSEHIEVPVETSSGHTPAVLKILSGSVNNQTEVHLKDLVTYIGTSDQAVVKIKGFMAPSLAAAISKRPEGYFLKAVKAGYPKVNGNAVNEQIFLENGAQIEVGGTNMVFFQAEGKKAAV